MYDTHIHSTFSHDGISKLEEYKNVIDKGIVKGIGFTEHRDFMPGCGGYGTFQYQSYAAAIKAFRENGYEFHSGAEIDYAKQVEEEIFAALARESYEYIICSVHTIDGVSLSVKGAMEGFNGLEGSAAVLDRYYSEVNHSLRVEQFDVIGHIGIYRRYLEKDYLDKSSLYAGIAEMENELAKACAVSDKIIEVNSSGLFSQSESLYASETFLRTYFMHGGRMISLGSDAHRADDVAKGFTGAIKTLLEIGFQYLYLPWDRENPIKIN